MRSLDDSNASSSGGYTGSSPIDRTDNNCPREVSTGSQYLQKRSETSSGGIKKPVKLSIVDQSPVSSGFTAADALQNSIELAKLADRLGYERFWIAEHHAMETLASPAPEVLMARIAAETRSIRVGSGAVLLPHYSPLKVVETFRMLHALYPNRIDLGLGRAPGGSPLEAFALQRHRDKQQRPDDFREQLEELLAFLHGSFPADHPFSRIRVSPQTPGAPEVWLLGSSSWSAATAAELGLPYAFAHFIDPEPTRIALEEYRLRFQASEHLAKPQALVALGVLCAETQEEADRLFLSSRLLLRRIRQGDRRPVPSPEEAARELDFPSGPDPLFPGPGEWPRYIVGTPKRVASRLRDMAAALKIEEIMAVTIVHDHRARLRSYELLADALDIVPRVAPEAMREEQPSRYGHPLPDVHAPV